MIHLDGKIRSVIYLDHAATSFPKPAPVLQAIAEWYGELGVSAARGDGSRSQEVARRVAAARQQLGRLAGQPGDRVAFTSGATEGLNLALRAILRPGDGVLTTVFEHSSVVRPLLALQRERQLQLAVQPLAAHGGLSLDDTAAMLAAQRPQWVVMTHGSNVTGALFDAAAVAELAHRHGARLLLDASQTAGYVDLDVGADLVVASAHKALQGPPGLGFLIAAPDLELLPQKQGGSGSSTALTEHPTEWPQAFEAGTPNTPAILGLAAALAWLAEQGPAQLLASALAHTEALAERLRRKPGLRLLQASAPRLPVLSVLHRDYDPAELGAICDAAQIHVRSGYHCAPWLHEALGTSRGGTLRLSPGPELTADEIQRVAAALPD